MNDEGERRVEGYIGKGTIKANGHHACLKIITLTN